MPGFLDKNIRVNDFVLTDYGKKKLSDGTLNFKYYSFSDDGIDYEPFISTSGSLTDSALTSSKINNIEDSLVREAATGMSEGVDSNGEDFTNIRYLLFTMPQGQKVLPTFEITPDVTGSEIDVQQQKLQDKFVNIDNNNNIINEFGLIDRGFNNFKSSELTIDFNLENYFDDVTLDGFQVVLFESGSNGLREIKSKRDLQNIISYSSELKLYNDNLVDLLNNKKEEG